MSSEKLNMVPPSGGSLEIGNYLDRTLSERPAICSPFGGIPRNWKPREGGLLCGLSKVPPSGGSLEIGNRTYFDEDEFKKVFVPPSGGSLEIGNLIMSFGGSYTRSC